LSAEYNWTTREFDVSLKLCTQDTELNCFEAGDISWITGDLRPLQDNTSVTSVACVRNESFESVYDSFDISMRTVYRENTLVPMRLYRNVTPEYKALFEGIDQDNPSTGIMVPYRFIMQYAGTREQAGNASLQSVQTLMHLYAVEESEWLYSFEFEKRGNHTHDILLFGNSSSDNMDNACAPGYKKSYVDERMYTCIGGICGVYPPCTPDTLPPTCTEDTFRLLAGPACRALPLAGSLCMRLLQYITGQQPPTGLSQRAVQVIPRIIDLQCAGAADTGMYVLVDALDGDGSEQQALAELLGLQDTSAAPARCCVAALDTDTDTSVCQICPDATGGRRRLLAAAATDGQDLSAQWYAVNTSHVLATAQNASAADTNATAQNASAADTDATAQNASAADTNATAQNASAADTDATAQNASAADTDATAQNASAADTNATAQNASGTEATARAANARASDVTGSTAGDAVAAGSSSSKSQVLPIILGSTLGSLALAVACVCCFCCLRKSTSANPGKTGVEAQSLLVYV
jgi:hypothetical protein